MRRDAGPSHEVLQTSQQRAIHTSSNTDAAQVKARGKGLTEATVNQQTSFTVDSSRAGGLLAALYHTNSTLTSL